MNAAPPCRALRRAAASGLLVAVALSGCGLPGGAVDREPEWAHDADSDRYYRPGVVSQGSGLLETHYPDVAAASPRWITDGRFTDPGERVVVPGPDDHWWQAVLQLDPDLTAELVQHAGEDEELESLAESAVRGALVPTMEDELEQCEGGWISVVPALTRQGHTNSSAGGDLIELAALCEDSGQLALSSLDM